MQVTVVDYGAGNIQSVLNAIWRAGGDPLASSDPEAVRQAERIVLPGVGAAGAAVDRLRELHLDQAMGDVKRGGRPVMGICVGMQVMADDLYEYGHHKGLGWMRGKVQLIESNEEPFIRVPHIGWRAVDTTDRETPLIGTGARDRHFYFCHSYRLAEDQDVAVARVTHGVPFTCAVQFDNVFACQFHPEKSQVAGELLLRRFLEWRP